MRSKWGWRAGVSTPDPCRRGGEVPSDGHERAWWEDDDEAVDAQRGNAGIPTSPVPSACCPPTSSSRPTIDAANAQRRHDIASQRGRHARSVAHSPMPRPPEHPRRLAPPSCPRRDPLGGPTRASSCSRPRPRPRPRPRRRSTSGQCGPARRAGGTSHVAGPRPAPCTRSAGCWTRASRPPPAP